MVQINFASREVSCKIVYYGPGLSGKTTNLQMVHEKVPFDRKGQMTSIATEGERTLFFDFLPLDLGSVAGMDTKFQLYTVPGQVYYNATRKLVLKGVDGLVFVADSHPAKMAENLQSWQNLRENLHEQGVTLDELPLVLQYNKRDLPNAVSRELMDDRLNAAGAPAYEAVATDGRGVIDTLRGIAGLVLDRLNEHDRCAPTAATRAAQQAAAARQAQAAGTATEAAPPPAVHETVATVRAGAPAKGHQPSALSDQRRRRLPAGTGEGSATSPERDSRHDARGTAEPPETPHQPKQTAPPLAPVDEAIGSGGGSVEPSRGGRTVIAVAASVLTAAAAIAAYMLWFRG